MSVKREFTAVVLERWKKNFSFQLLLLSNVVSISIRKTLEAENQREIFCKLEEVAKRKQTSLNIAVLTAKHFKKLMTHFTRNVYGDSVQLSTPSPKTQEQKQAGLGRSATQDADHLQQG